MKEQGIISNMTEDQLYEFFGSRTIIADGFYEGIEGTWRYELHPAVHPYVSRGEDIFVPGIEGQFDIYMWEEKA